MGNETIEYSKSIADRILLIMKIADLDVAGFAEFFKKSTSHIYGILNTTRPLSDSFAKEIGDKLGFEGTKIFNLNIKLPQTIKSSQLSKFKIEHKDNPEYFLSTKSKRSNNSFITEMLLKSDCFTDGYKYLNEIKEYCSKELDKEFISDQLSKALQYTVKLGLLKSTKKPIRLKNGNNGKRMVDVYFK